MKKIILLLLPLILASCSEKTKDPITVGEVKDNFVEIELCSYSLDCDNLEYQPCQGVQDYTFRQENIEQICNRSK